MLKRWSNHCLLRPEQVKPSDDRMKVVSVFNPGVIDTGDDIVLLVRVAEAVAEQRDGYIALPRWNTTDEQNLHIEIDWKPEEMLRLIDPRVVEAVADDLTRLTFTSHIRVVHSPDGLSIEDPTLAEAPRFVPSTSYEVFGVEDPRITRLDGRYYITYVAVSPRGACTALASTRDFVTFDRHGVIFPPENKDVLLFPQRFGGRALALHRPNPRTHFARPEMWAAWSDDLRHWGDHSVFLASADEAARDTQQWRIGRIGGGAPPFLTERGWVEIYHGNSKAPGSPIDDVGVYSGGALLMDHDNPVRIIAATTEPIMIPEADFETHGFVPDVVFPTGVVERDDRLLVYYGAADAVTAVVEWSRDELMQRLI